MPVKIFKEVVIILAASLVFRHLRAEKILLLSGGFLQPIPEFPLVNMGDFAIARKKTSTFAEKL